MGTTLPPTVYSKLVSKVIYIIKSKDIHRSHLEYVVEKDAKYIVEGIEEIMRECFSREIIAWHDYECNKDVVDCTCKDLAGIVAGKILGEHIEYDY